MNVKIHKHIAGGKNVFGRVTLLRGDTTQLTSGSGLLKDAKRYFRKK